MSDRMRYQLEQTNECATLYLAGGLAPHDATALEAVCASLPATVRTLRLDLRALGAVSAEAMDVIRRVLRYWEASRGGEFRLSTSHLMATYRPAQPSWAPAALGVRPPMNEALAGTYL